VEKVEQFRPIRHSLAGLEARTRVLEPPPPDQAQWEPRRMVALAPGVCLEVILNPLDPEAVPKIIILGPDRKINLLITALASNIHRYNSEVNLVDNLEKLLDTKLPPPASEEASQEESFNVDCGICYVYKLGESVPTEVCDNSHCAQPYHVECLYEYLTSSHNATKSHNTIFGKCPFCESDISCHFQSLKEI
jgi:E3 ubiquitin-protein ligase FANCL